MTYQNCCFTGHRKIEAGLLPPLRAVLVATLTDLIEGGCLHFYAGGALGFDTLAAEETLALRERYPGVALHLLLPCRDQCRSWAPLDVARYEAILTQADSYCYLGEAYSSAAMAMRNRALVERADICIAFLRREASGAGQTVRTARRAGLPVINLAERLAP